MKTYRLFVFVLFILVFFSGCKQGGDITIGFLMPDGEGSRWPIDQSYVEAAARQQGVEIVSRFVENDENMQQKQATELLELGVDVLIVVSVNANTAAAIVRDAHNYDVPVVAYDRLIRNSDVDYYVSFEGASIGKVMLDHAISKVPKGNYVMLWGDPGDLNAVFIKEAQEEYLKPFVDRGDINIVYKGYVDNWTAENAYHKMSEILDFSDQKIDAVVTSYDGLAVGALEAIREHPEQDIKVLTGQDAEMQAIQALLNDEMSLTVYKSIKTIASAAVDVAVKLARGEKIAVAESKVNNGRVDVPSLLLDPVPVTKNTIRSTVIADGYYTEEEVYGN
ncbi:sugar ABC transporter substrate-binding protein [Roseimarinus sediminis]|jgi:D-xylose transport system substrate-binding protein|uniref:sugar ABC transporter substrate-binding protein n=1 Tax=Roseimarinus sediminis TaxID=1610899 RepID=UPI003D1E7C82